MEQIVTTKKARKLLGSKAKHLSDEELSKIIHNLEEVAGLLIKDRVPEFNKGYCNSGDTDGQ